MQGRARGSSSAVLRREGRRRPSWPPLGAKTGGRRNTKREGQAARLDGRARLGRNFARRRQQRPVGGRARGVACGGLRRARAQVHRPVRIVLVHRHLRGRAGALAGAASVAPPGLKAPGPRGHAWVPGCGGAPAARAGAGWGVAGARAAAVPQRRLRLPARAPRACMQSRLARAPPAAGQDASGPRPSGC